MDKFETQITNYVHGLTYRDLTQDAVQAAKERYLDSLAVALAAFHTPPVKAMRKFALESSSATGATVLGTRHKAPVDYATVYLGTMIRALDWNDTYLNREPAHPSDNIAACLPVAEANGKTGKDLILATVVAYELHCRLCDAAGIRKKGWDHVTYGSVSSSAAAAKLMDFSKRQIRDTLAIAVTTGNYLRQTRVGTISQWKAAAFAQAAQNAVRAALYVKHGFTGPSDIFTGQHGFINQITLGEFDLAGQFAGPDSKDFKIADTYIKFFPAEYHSQSAIWAALQLRESIGHERLREIAKIHIETSFHSYEIIGKEPAKWAPETKETADHSLPYIVAAALIDGNITLQQFDDSHLNNPELRSLMQKVTVAEKKKYTEIYGKSFPNKVIVTLANGAVHEKEVLDPKGHPNNPLTPKEIETKFKTAAAPLLSEEKQNQIIDSIGSLEKIENLTDLMRLLEVK
ncbi:MAG: MmgE/PrpD family protein [Nitrospinales bacterium]